MPEHIRFKTRLFADDTIVYLTITSDIDSVSLQDAFMFAFLIFRFRFKKLMVFAFLQMFDVCWFHFISDVIETPRYFAVVTCSSW
jgi:hypothetical protein